MNWKSFWAGLQPRERLTLLGGGIALLFLLIYAGVWDPYQQAVRRLEQSVTEQGALLDWMQQKAADVRKLRGANPTPPVQSGQSLLAVVDSTAKEQGLGGALKRVQPEGGTGVRVWLEQASFDDVLRWLDTLQRTQRVQVSSLAVERQKTPGRVDVRLLLERGAEG